MPYSNSGGGTLTLSSPTHVHHVDVTSAVRSLRRSLSRSPSKFRLVTKSPSPSSKSPLSPSSLSPPKRASLTPSIASATPRNSPHTSSPLAVPFPPSVKLALRSSSRAKPTARSSSRTRTSPKSPIKRHLHRTTGSNNTPPIFSTDNTNGKEGNSNPVPSERANMERASSKVSLTNETHNSAGHTRSRFSCDGSNDVSSAAPKSSPLKRSDAIMNLDQASLGSPVAKRRSLHGSANFGHDFNVFDHAPSTFEISDDPIPEFELSSNFNVSDMSAFSSLPRRSSSLRKSTLQQRHGEKTSWGRRHAAQILAAQQAASAGANSVIPETPTLSHAKNRPRLSLDQFMPPQPRDSSFTHQANLPNASVHVLNPNSCHQPHPLSRTVTTASSSSSNSVEEPSNLVSTHPVSNHRQKSDFSKSLPVGALRPFRAKSQSVENGLFATPENYKSVRPLPSAFASTGLISKVNRNPENMIRDLNKSNVPDTPCKKHVNGFATYPAPVPGSAIIKARHIRHSFGTPSTPFNPHGNPVTGAFPQCAGVFGNAIRGRASNRRGSFLGVDIDENNSPEEKCDIQSIADLELPPTPTKQALVFKQVNGSHSASIIERTLIRKISGSNDDPTTPLGPIGFLELLAPTTPQDIMAPPDPSGLSISNHRNLHVKKSTPTSMPPPVTPTTGREYHFKVGVARRLSTTPINAFAQTEVDISLSSKFEKVEMIGTGEFSQVFRVTKKAPAPNPENSVSALPDRIFAVKKSKQPFQGVRDRERKLKEVHVLQALTKSDHVVHLMESWEDKNYLYIQTEYCEEGSMDLFLSQVGRKGRLDDFRIWKIMLELSLGLKHVHDSGFIHLDLKPANILITFEGVLKIADFGMATSWPAQPGIEGEGDREYIGPEILEGNFDKPADVFALGLIMFEIAGNVQLPDNGPSWQRLRSGDISDVPSLTWSCDSQTRRDITGSPVDESELNMENFGSDDDIETHLGSPSISTRKRHNCRSTRSLSYDASNLFSPSRRGELQKAPPFMRDMYHETSLDRLVKWMLKPNPPDRPTVHQILETEGILWVKSRRRAGATVYEGNWGPADEVLADDTEMTGI
ncbi:hypothetical protein K3495_g2780 [Podosphaera aphanis]|nr:hypothetical protein K3495_g2780 [Podosphaera aphanis]